MHLKKPREEWQVIQDKVYSAMETGNAGVARTVLREYAEINAAKADDIRVDVLADYGISL